MIKRIITKFLLVSLISVVLISLHATIYITYLTDAGLNFKEVGLVNLFYLLALFVLEIPGKIIINLLGKKVSLIVSAVLHGIGLGLYSIVYNLLGFISAEVFIAAGTVLASGALKSWLIDSSSFYEWKGKPKGTFRWKGRVLCFAKLIVGFSAAYIGVKSLSLPFAVAGLGYWSLAISSLLVKEEIYLQGAKMKKTPLVDFRKITQESVAYVWQDDLIFIVIGLIIIIALGFPSLSLTQQQRYYPIHSNSCILTCLWLLIGKGVLLSKEMTRFCSNEVHYDWKIII